MAKPALANDDSWETLLTEVDRRFAPNSFEHKEGWVEACDPFGRRLQALVLNEVERADARLAVPTADRLAVTGNLWGQPHLCATTTLRADDAWFLREGKPWHRPPEGHAGGNFYVEVMLYAPRPASHPDWYLRPSVGVQLHIAYALCEPFRWLLKEWHRPLGLMLRPVSERPWINDCGRPQLKGFRGKDCIREVELYLQDAGRDPAFAFEFSLQADTPPEQVTRAFTVFLAVWDALYMLTVPRCDPDRLHKHYLKLRDTLPGVAFRESFYDPGIDPAALADEPPNG